MNTPKPSLPKGTRDFGPADMQKRKHILNTLEKVFRKYGFMSIETPAMENLSTLEGKYGDEGDQLLYKIRSNKSLKDKHPALNDLYPSFIPEPSDKGLRYDLTVPFARYVVMNRDKIAFPFRRYQMQPVWRGDRPQKGRYREFWQCDADIVGSDSLVNEIDLVRIYDEAFRSLGLNRYALRINNRKVLAGIAEVVRSADQLTTISVAIDKLDKIGEAGVKEELAARGFTQSELTTLFDIIGIRGQPAEQLSLLKEKLSSSPEGLKGVSELEFIIGIISESPVNLEIDISLARGLSYYTGCIFEVVSAEGTLKSSIGGGGRYDNLTGIFGLPGVSGVGISFGVDRICDVMEELDLFPTELRLTDTRILLCAFDIQSQSFALNCLEKLRSAGISSEIYPDLKKIGKQLDYANALHIPYAAIIGENEVKSGMITLKNLGEGSQESLSLDDIITRLSR